MVIAHQTPKETWLEVEALAFDLGVDEYCDLTRDVHAPVPIYTDSTPFVVQGTQWVLDDILFSKADLGSFAFSSAPSSLQDYGHLVTFDRMFRGSNIGMYNDEPVEHHGPVISMTDMQTVSSGLYLNGHSEEMYFPKTRLGYAETDLLPAPDIYPGMLIGDVVFAEWDRVFAPLRRGDQYVSANAVDRLLSCLKIALGTSPQREDVRAHAREALFDHICRYIDAQIEHSEVTASDLLRKFGVSRAGLYRMFEPHGGVRNYITTRRTIRAMFEISQKVNQRGIITAAAERWGFSSAPNFNRVVKRILGSTPGALFKAPTRSTGKVSQGSMLIDQFVSTVA